MAARRTLGLLGTIGIAGLLWSSAGAQVDSTSTATAPAMKPGFMYYVSADKLVAIEETPIEIGAGTSASGLGAAAFGFGSGVKSFMILLGKTSELKIPENQPRFRIAIDRPSSQRIRLAHFEVKKDKRQARTESAHLLEFFKPAVQIEVTKVADGVYEFKPAKPLQPGEYGFAASLGGPTVADFTIVAPETTKK